MKPFRPLKVRNYVEQVARLRVPLWTEHAHQAFRHGVFVMPLSSAKPMVALM